MTEYIDSIHAIVAVGLALIGGFIVGLCVGFRLAEKTRPDCDSTIDRVSVPINQIPGPPPVSQKRPKVRRHGPERTP